MTTDVKRINITILTYLLRNRSFRPVKLKYNINYNQVTVLCGIYIYTLYVKNEFSLHQIFKFVRIFSYKNMLAQLNRLENNKLISLAGVKKYRITQTGIDAVNLLLSSYDNILYEFCNKYNVVL